MDTRTRPTDARARLVDEARHRFAVDGALATTLDDVRKQAGVSVGSLYHHFPSKSALAAAVYAEVVADYQAGLVSTLRAHRTAEDGIRAAVRHHLEWVERHRDDAVLLFGERHDSTTLRDANSATFEAVRDWWAPHRAYGMVADLDPIVTYALWFGPVHEYARIRVASTDTSPVPPGVAETFAEAAWHALRAEAPSAYPGPVR